MLVDNITSKNQFNELMSRLYYYYPIGISFLYQEYQGYHEIQSILINKLEKEIPNYHSCSYSLENLLNKQIPNLKISNLNYLQFPSYVFNIYISSFENQLIKSEVSLVINISLLVDYFTIFFEKKVISKIGEKSVSVFKSHFFTLENGYSEIVEKVFEALQEIFPNKKYIYHYSIKQQIISEVIPFGFDTTSIETKQKFSFYDLLFSNEEIQSSFIDIKP